MGRHFLLPGVMEGCHMVVMKRVKTIGATDIEDSTGVGGPLRPMNKNAFVDRIIDSVNDPQFKTECLSSQGQ